VGESVLSLAAELEGRVFPCGAGIRLCLKASGRNSLLMHFGFRCHIPDLNLVQSV
jgi:hypothetical protein